MHLTCPCSDRQIKQDLNGFTICFHPQNLRLSTTTTDLADQSRALCWPTTHCLMLIMVSTSILLWEMRCDNLASVTPGNFLVHWNQGVISTVGLPPANSSLLALQSAEQLPKHWWRLCLQSPLWTKGGREKLATYVKFTLTYFLSQYLWISLLISFQTFSASSVWFSKSHLRLHFITQPNHYHYFQLLKPHWIQNSGTPRDKSSRIWNYIFPLVQASIDAFPSLFLIWIRKMLQFLWWVNDILLVLTM